MAALLKKRALAEFTQTTTTNEEAPPQKYKCVLKPSSTSSSAFALLNLLETNNNNLQLLLLISEKFRFQEKDIPDLNVVNKLSEHFRKEKESAVRVLILSILADVGTMHNVNSQLVQVLIDEIIDLLMNETSHKVLSQGLATLLSLGKLLPTNIPLRLRLIQQAKEHLIDTSPSVKCRCFDIFGELLPIDTPDDNTIQTQILKLLGEYIHNENARTRSCAFKNMLTLHHRGLKLDPSIYAEVCVALKDDYEDVRAVALKLIWLLGTSYPQNIVHSSNSDEEIPLIDDAFGNICNLIIDLSVRVRTEAAQLLGTMNEVSLPVLLQTLDKRLMADMRKKKSAHERAIENVSAGTYVRGKGYTHDRPKEQLDEDQVNIMKSGAYGAFVHGLEDEFLEVRSASIDSICMLAVKQPNYAVVALDFLVDMFNDDIQEVRLKAIDSLCKMSDHIEFREDQLEIILGLLEDSSMDVREGLQRILTSCSFVTKDCLQMCVNQLLDSLKKYPQDKKSIWNCFHKMGSLHASLALPLVPELLAIHPFFDTPEPNVDDPAYVSILLLIFNAAQHCSTIIELLEEKTIKHYSYLRDTMPHLVPYLPLSSTLTSVEMKSVPTATAKFLETLLTRIETIENSRVLFSLLEVAEKDLARLSQIDTEVAGTAKFNSLFIKSQLLYASIVNNRLWHSNLGVEQHNLIKNSIGKLLKITMKMQYLFTGLNSAELAAIKQFKLRALGLLLVHLVKSSNQPVTNQSAKALCHYFVVQVEKVNRFLTEEDISAESFTLTMSKEMSELGDMNIDPKKPQNLKPEEISRVLLPLLQNFKPICPPKPNMNIKMCNAVINSPIGGPDTTYKFTAGLVMSIPLDAEISHLHSTKPLRLRLRYPDQQTHLIVPRIDHLRPDQFYSDVNHMYRLVTTALISHQVWSEACFVELSLVLDVTETEGAISNLLQPLNQLCVISLCKPVKLHVSPKPVRRGI